MGEVLLALKGEQLSSFIYTKSLLSSFNTALLSGGTLVTTSQFMVWLGFIHLPQPPATPLLRLHPGLQDTVSSTNVGDTMAFLMGSCCRIFPDPMRWAAGGNGPAPGTVEGRRALLCSRGTIHMFVVSRCRV